MKMTNLNGTSIYAQNYEIGAGRLNLVIIGTIGKTCQIIVREKEHKADEK